MAAPVSKRQPYAEREQTIREFCSCHWLWSERDGIIIRHERLWRDPKCRLHGNDTKEAPY
jgi:hypothetical protein